MADLLAGTGGARAANGGALRTGPVPVLTGSGQQATPSQSQMARQRITTPRDIMRKRQEKAEEAARARQEAEQPGATATAAGASGPSPGASDARTPQQPSQNPSGGHRRTTSAAPSSGRTQQDQYQYPPYTRPQQPQAMDAPNDGPSDPPPPQNLGEPIPQYRPRVSSVSQGEPRPVAPQASQAGPSGPSRTASGQAPAVQPVAAGSAVPRPTPSAGPTSAGRVPGDAQRASQATQGTASSFPHAFERWETLSSHWEGLTSYWIRKLEQNTEELQRQPLMAQLSRQVTDLSAAGANLFHAVVELQRLRASSERKFQRWFFESRKEQERSQEIAAQLQEQVDLERNSRSTDLTRIQAELENSKRAEKNAVTLVQEIRRELQISKDEARRAWEELGRREQEDRDRILALQNKQPIEFGGIQVLPTAPGMGESEIGEHSPTNTDPFIEQGPPRMHQQQQEDMSQTGYQPYPPGSAYARSDSTARTAIPASSTLEQFQPIGGQSQLPYRPTASPSQPKTQHINVTSGSHAMTTQPETVGPANPFYQQPAAYLHTSAQGARPDPYLTSDGASDAGDELYATDALGRIMYDQQGHPIPLRRPAQRPASSGRDDYEPEHQPYASSTSGIQYPSIPALSSSTAPQGAGRYSTASAVSPITPTTTGVGATSLAPPTTSVGRPGSSSSAGSAPSTTSAPPGPADYSGAGYGPPSAYDQGRNYYPSRLSDVLEQDEDERSRVSEVSGHSGGRYGGQGVPF